MMARSQNSRYSLSITTWWMALVDAIFALLIVFILLWFSNSFISMPFLEALIVKASQSEVEAIIRGRFATHFATGDMAIEVDGNIQRTRFGNHLLFDSGVDTLKTSARALLDPLTEVLRSSTSKGYVSQIMVEGYTDSDPWFKKRGPVWEDGNWELSVRRAKNVVKYFQAGGVDPRLLAATGYSHYRNKYPDNNEDNKRKNRRLELVLIHSSVKQR